MKKLLYTSCLLIRAQESEMFFLLQYWYEEENEVRTCYLGSTYLGHSATLDLMDKLNKAIKHFYPKKLSYFHEWSSCKY